MRDRVAKYLLLLPGIVVVFLASIWPITKAFKISFMSWKLSRNPEPVPLWTFDDGWGEILYLFDNFIYFLDDSLAFNSIKVTLIFTILSVTLTGLFSMSLALLLFKGGVTRGILRSILLFPFAMNPALVGVSWRFMFNPDFGLLHFFFGSLFPGLAEVDWLGHEYLAMAVLIISDVWHWTPYITLFLIGGLTGVPKDAQEASLIDGASSWRSFFDITFPIILPTLGVAIILKTIFSLKMFDQVYMLTNGGPGHATQTLAHYIYEQGFKYYDMGYASALSYWLVLPLFFLAVAYVKLVFTQK